LRRHRYLSLRQERKLFEHWDVLQIVPSESANANSMFQRAAAHFHVEWLLWRKSRGLADDANARSWPTSAEHASAANDRFGAYCVEKLTYSVPDEFAGE
jgi:hypothetical protein